MNTNKVWTIILFCAVALLIRLDVPCYAQSLQMAPARIDLGARINLPSGSMPLRTVLRVLSKAAGGVIKSEPAIEDHLLVVSMEGVTVKSALEAIIDLNHWRWVDTPDGEIIVARPRVQRPQQIEEIIPAFHAILPPSLKHYLGMHVATGNRHCELTGSDGKLSTISLQQTAQELSSTHCIYEGLMNDPKLLSLWPCLPEKTQHDGNYPFTKWSKDDLQKVLMTLLGFTSGRIYNSGNASSVLKNYLYHCQVQPQAAVLRIGRDRDDKPNNFGVYYGDPQYPAQFVLEFATNLPFVQDKLMPIEEQELHP